jgi:tRNA threonylcarbamoyladenosine biosynthesis protein TsaE
MTGPSQGAGANPAHRTDQRVTVSLRSAQDTRAAGLALGRALPPRALVLLRGELGAGKTTLVKAACEALGIAPATVISPTYTLVNIYPGPPAIYHVDLYRLERPEAMHDLDEGDWINPDGPTFIEWPEIAEPLLAGRPALRVTLSHAATGRTLAAASAAPEYAAAVAALAAAAPQANEPQATEPQATEPQAAAPQANEPHAPAPKQP